MISFLDYLVQKELRSFFALLESLHNSFRSWTSQIKDILALQVDIHLVVFDEENNSSLI